MPTLRWLHLSDLHVGMAEQGWLWPRYGTQLEKDLERIHTKAGPWDLVIFSGDLVNFGTEAEYEKLDGILDRIWSCLNSLGSTPVLITTPGNHDLSRSATLAPELVALEQYWKKPDLREAVFEGGGEYNRFVKERFANYDEWLDRSISSGRHLKPSKTGILPGDASYNFSGSDASASIICLNSTWLQLSGADYKGQLSVDPRQIMTITDGDPDKWLSESDFSLLVTHQPTDWLEKSAQSLWFNEINPTDRFDLHLFGHMHEPELSRAARGGSNGRRSAQSASLFGLEKLPDGSTSRVQGYSAYSLSHEDGKRKLVSWPRVVVETGDHDRKLAPDTSQDLGEDNSFNFEYALSKPAAPKSRALPVVIEGTLSPNKALENVDFDLSSIRVLIPEAKNHKSVRKVEQLNYSNRISQSGAIWLVADWGMAAQAFLAAGLDTLQIDERSFYRLDCSEYDKQQDFFAYLGDRLGSPIETVLTAISNVGSAVLLLDDVSVSSLNSAENVKLISELERLISIVQDFSPETRIVLRTRMTPLGAKLPIVSLASFDEADLATYVRENDLGGPRYAKPDAVGIIFRRTDGVPARVDDALRDLQVTSLNDLALSNPDYADPASVATDAPESLILSIEQIRSSPDPEAPRAYELLLALSALPHGEQLARIRRLLGVHPFHTNHARYLLDRGLLSSSIISGLGEGEAAEQVRALVVPRIVREYVLASMDEAKFRDLDRLLLEMYFGAHWNSSGIDNSPIGKRAKSPLADSYEISNSGTLILRSLIRASSSEGVLFSSLVRLASSFAALLLQGSHYRNTLSLIDDIFSLINEDNYKKELNIFRVQRARSLRMLGSHQLSLECSMEIDLDELSKDQRQEIHLTRALTYETIGDQRSAKECAEQVISINKKSVAALQAEAVIAEQIIDPTDRVSQLRAIMARARKRGAEVLVNNILLTLTKEPSITQNTSMLREVIDTTRKTKDYYNMFRATIYLAENSGNAGNVSKEDKNRLIGAYHLLHAERMSGLFDRCHDCLWNIFEDTNDTENLLNLFRHSSFIWRLAGRDGLEQKYLKRLTGKIAQLVGSNIPNIDRDKAYFMVRVSVVIGAAETK